MTSLAARPAPIAIPPRPTSVARPSLAFADPESGIPLETCGESLINPITGASLASIIPAHGVPIPRFVDHTGGYAATFGWQWKRWRDTLSDAANSDDHRYKLILERTHFGNYDLRGKTLLECGCGAGNDTDALAALPLAEIHAFDLSPAVEEAAPLAARLAKDSTAPRLILSQADIMRIPYPDRAFDVVFCHRVLQHTPDPAAALRAICRKVKPGGLLFAHCYLDSPLMRRHYRHKLRWLAKRLPPALVVAWLNLTAPILRPINNRLRARAARGGKWGARCQAFSHAWIPFTYSGNMWAKLGKRKQIQIEKLITFDAITAWHDHPMTPQAFRSIIEGEGFTIEHMASGPDDPPICTARLIKP